MRPLSRRRLLRCGVALAAAVLPPFVVGRRSGAAPMSAPAATAAAPFRFCLNTSTIRGQKLSLPDTIDLAAETGYHAIEPWISEIEAYTQAGGKLPDLRQRLRDRNLAVPSAIGFFEWIVDDPARREKALEQAKRDMGLVAALGGTHIAAPPWGAHDRTKIEKNVDLLAAAERYHALCEVGRGAGVVPMVEVWGFSHTLSRLGEAALVAVESGHPDACILADVYHLHKGGSPINGLALLQGSRLPVFHVNDYPADPPPAAIQDKDRVFPGDGVAPLAVIFSHLRAVGFDGYLSLELFNEAYYKQDARTVARTGLEKMRAAVGKTGAAS
jgi:sugar phosphate isomerase/epimerase